MDYLKIILLLSFLWAIFSALLSKISKATKLPPGPRPFPIIGNLLELGDKPHRSLTTLSKTHGPIITLNLGNITTIVISFPDIAKEALVKHASLTSSRTIPYTGQVLDHHKFSIVWLPPSSQWRTLRKACATNIFSPHQLDSTQSLRQKKVKDLLDHVEKASDRGEAIDIGEAAFTTMLNIISNTFFSIDLASYSSDLSQDFREIVVCILEEVGKPNLADFFSVFRLVDPQGLARSTKKHFQKLLKILDRIIDDRVRLRAEFSDADCKPSNDILDSFLALTDGESPELNRNDILHALSDLFLAGVDTSSTSLEWAMAELLRNPEKLAKVRQEIHQVAVDKEGQFDESDTSKMTYLKAIVKETLRLHPPAPFLVPHKADQDIEICGYTVPKNAQILVNVWAIGRSSGVWSEPERFMPERFLHSEIDFKGNDFELIPFGAGRRICPGLPLAYRAMHSILASLLLRFDWRLADGGKPEEMDMAETFGLTMHKNLPLRVFPIKV